MSRFVPEDILVVLNHVEWKSGMEISHELALLKCQNPSSFWGLLFRKPVIGWLYVNLERFERHGLITSRWRNSDEETLARRGGNRIREFQLTSGGLRQKDEVLEARKEAGRVGRPATHPT